MTQVNRYLKDKAMDYIDHALGRPVDPLGDTYRNYFYVVGDTALRRQMTASPHWWSAGVTNDGEYFEVSDEGRNALAAHLKAIGDRNRKWIVRWGGHDMECVAPSRAKARYIKWLDIRDADCSVTFSRFQRESRVSPC